MACRQRFTAGRFFATLATAAVIAGCASPRPAPVLNRTDQPLPGQPGSPGSSETSPLTGSGIDAGGRFDPNLRTGPKGFKRPYGEVAAADAWANPSARPGAGYASGAAGTPGGTAPGAAAATAVPAPAVVATTAPPSAAGTSAGPASGSPATAPLPTRPSPPPAAGSAGILDGVAFAWPAAGTVLQNFDQTSSKGLALGGRPGDVVRSAADGRVIFSGAGPRGYGNLVIVKHDNELLSVYAHNQSLAVKEGESVRRGQKIAELGNSGTDTPKLHFEIRQQGKPIDPLAVLPRR